MQQFRARPEIAAPDPTWDDLVDRLAVYDICYLTGGSAWDGKVSPYRGPDDVPVDRLVMDLAQAPHGRLADALVALLFRHPEFLSTAMDVASLLGKDDRARLQLYASVLAAAALRVTWSFVLAIYLPGQPKIDVDHVAALLGVPFPDEDGGRACLAAVATLLRTGQPFPFNYESAWNGAAEHVLEELRAVMRERKIWRANT